MVVMSVVTEAVGAKVGRVVVESVPVAVNMYINKILILWTIF